MRRRKRSENDDARREKSVPLEDSKVVALFLFFSSDKKFSPFETDTKLIRSLLSFNSSQNKEGPTRTRERTDVSRINAQYISTVFDALFIFE